jgi:hypothetical protein
MLSDLFHGCQICPEYIDHPFESRQIIADYSSPAITGQYDVGLSEKYYRVIQTNVYYLGATAAE